jgi:CxxC motif-containing protein (DUF1111 family)
MRALFAVLVSLVSASASLSACGEAPAPGPTAATTAEASGLPLAGLDESQRARFVRGDELFELALRPFDGLGPLYTRASCAECHLDDARGPGVVQKMVLLGVDGVTPAADQSDLAFGHTVHPLTAGSARTPIAAPSGRSDLRVSERVGPSVLGMGYLEAISDDDLRAEAAAQASRGDGVSGRLNLTTYASEPNADSPFNRHQRGDPVIGRFGLKARIATLDEFVADALQHDMGITSPLRLTEFPNPDGLADDLKAGVDVTLESVNLRADYVRMLRIPTRAGLSEPGRAAFRAAGCHACHRPSWTTRADYPIPPLAGVEAPVFTDLLLHDMGEALSDSLPGQEGDARLREWRTSPLIGLRYNRTFMHDGRALSVSEAIEAHEGAHSEANEAVAAYRTLSEHERAALLEFVGAL